MRLLIRKKATVNARTRRSLSALMMAAEAGQLESVRLLIASGATEDLNALDRRGYSALHMAVENGHDDIAKELIDAGADVRIPRNNEWTCMLSAAFMGAAPVMEILVKHSADVNAPIKGSSHGCAPIHLAAYNGFASSLDELGRPGARVNQAMDVRRGHVTEVGQ